MGVQLYEKEQQIYRKEQEIKNLRNKNHHLQNFRSVYDYRMSTLMEEKEPLTNHLGQLDDNVKSIFKELIDEAEANKKIDQNLKETG
jgi:chromosome segregation ATPase